MKSLVKCLFFCNFFVLTVVCQAQQQQQQEIQPEEMAAKEVELLETELNLTPSQSFYVDSILHHNYRALFDEFQDMRESGRQNAETYKYVSEKWLNKNLEALNKVLDEQQYIMYLKHVGKGKEYKRGKDGLYYKKEAKQKGEKSK